MEENTAPRAIISTMPRTITSAKLKEFVNSDEFELIVQKNHAYYKKVWLSWAEDEGSINLTSLTAKTSWNWVAFLCPYCWFLYRKMYREVINLFATLFFVPVLILLIGQSFAWDASVENFLMLVFLIVFMVILGIYGNSMYLESCLERLRTANEKFSNSVAVTAEIGADDTLANDINCFLQEAGGTNLMGVLVYLGGIAIILFIALQGAPQEKVAVALAVLTLAMLVFIHMYILNNKIVWSDPP